MAPRLRRNSPAKVLLRSTAIALIAMVMPLGVQIASDGFVSIELPSAHAGNHGGGGGNGGGGGGGGSDGDNGLGNGGEESQGEDDEPGSDPSNPAKGNNGDDGGSVESGGGESGGESGDDDESSPGPGIGVIIVATAPGALFSGSVAPAGPDLSENEERELIARGWQ